MGSIASSPLNVQDIVIEEGPEVTDLSSDVFVHSTPSTQLRIREAATTIREAQTPNDTAYNLGDRIKQYGSNTLIVGGATLVFVLMFTPEPFVTKIIAGVIGLTCILAGAIVRHQLYKNAYLSGEIDYVVEKLGTRVNVLQQEVTQLDLTRQKLETINEGLENTNNEFNDDVSNLSTQVARLKVEVSEAYASLNEQRRIFENEWMAQIAQLHSEIREADARGAKAGHRLDELDIRDNRLDQSERELDESRRNLLSAELKLQEMQTLLLRRFDRRLSVA